MIWLAAGVLLLFVLAGAGRRARQREMVASLRRNFVVEAMRSLANYLPKLAPALTDAQLGRLFDEIYAEHLRRFRARNFADLLRKGQSPDAVSISSDICTEVGKRLCATHQDCDPDLMGMALSDALMLAGPDMYADMVPNG
jgi:hypothetical protein